MTTNRNALLRLRLQRVVELLRGARSELAAARYNNSLNRAYYACFHVGAALRELRGDAMDPSGRWEHRRTMARTKRILGLADDEQPFLTNLVTLRERADYVVEVNTSLDEANYVLQVALSLRQLTSEILPWMDVDDVS